MTHEDNEFFQNGKIGRKNQEDFFEKKNGLLLMNTNMWNNPQVVGLTGYSISMIKEPLYELAKFIRENLTPDRLEGFDLEAIIEIKDFKQDTKMSLTNK